MRRYFASPSVNVWAALLTVSLLLVLLESSWWMYNGITTFEVDVAHNSSILPWATLAIGIVACCEVIGVLLIFTGNKVGFTVVVVAELIRGIAVSFTGLSMLSVIAIKLIVIYYLSYRLYWKYLESPPSRAPSIQLTPREEGSATDIFLSYSRKQFYFSESLMLRLESHHISVWFDAQRIHAGTDWRESIDQGLSNCTSMVVVASRAALASREVDYEWRTAQERGTPIYVVLFEPVDLPPELRRNAVAIIDMRTRFERKARELADLISRHASRHGKTPAMSALRLPLRLPLSITFMVSVLLLILSISIFFNFLNAKVLTAVIVPNSSNIYMEDGPLSVQILGVVFHGFSSKVYVLLGVCLATLLVTTLTVYVLVNILYRRRFVFVLLPVALCSTSLLFLNTIFIQNSTDHIVVGHISGGCDGCVDLIEVPANWHSMAWRDFDTMLFNRHVENVADTGSSYLSVGDERMWLAATAAQWRWPTLLLLALAISACVLAYRSGSLLRWLPTGEAPDRMRMRCNKLRWFEDKTHDDPSDISGKRLTSWRLLYHSFDHHIAEEIETELTRQPHIQKGAAEQADISIALLTNHTSLAWLESIEQKCVNLIYVLCVNIRHHESLKLLRRRQWFDYRHRSSEKIRILAQSLGESSKNGKSYMFPVIPESVERSITPLSVWYKSHAMRFFATWYLAMSIFGGGRVFGSLDDLAGRIIPPLVSFSFSVSVPSCLYLFWLAIKLESSNICYPDFRQELNTVMTILGVSQIQFLCASDDQLSLIMLGILINTFLAVAWFTPMVDKIKEWLPAEKGVAEKSGETLAIPLRQQFWPSSLVYLALFLFFYSSGVIFFADLL